MDFVIAPAEDVGVPVGVVDVGVFVHKAVLLDEVALGLPQGLVAAAVLREASVCVCVRVEQVI